MTQYLPPNLLALFAPRDPAPFLPPPDKLPHEKKNRGYQGVGDFLQGFEDPKDTPPPTRGETREERLERRQRERAEQVAYKLEQEIAMWDPHNLGTTATTDPFKTLFVARINYDTSESKLRREFEGYGPIKKIVLTHNINDGKPRGYAFIEYEHERDMHTTYKHADGKKIDGRRVLVDVERGRTVKGWLPRRLGKGLGGTRRGGPEVNIKHSGREDNERERERYRLERERESREDLERERGGPSSNRGGGGGDRERRRSRSRDRTERRKRSRSRSPRERKRHRTRSRDRAERRNKDGLGADVEEPEERPPRERGERERERGGRNKEGGGGGADVDEERPPREGRDRGDRERGERDRKRSRRSRSRDRGDRKKDKRDRGDRKERRGREGGGGGYDRQDDGGEPRIKEEPLDDYDYIEPPNYQEFDLNAVANANPSNVKFEQELNGSRRAALLALANNSYEDEDDL